ncbi:MAG: hypothetical protein H7224_08650 [Polaromonas sp.]|nr:hypothetical protein [Polaromonas sp.]
MLETVTRHPVRGQSVDGMVDQLQQRGQATRRDDPTRLDRVTAGQRRFPRQPKPSPQPEIPLSPCPVHGAPFFSG